MSGYLLLGAAGPGGGVRSLLLFGKRAARPTSGGLGAPMLRGVHCGNGAYGDSPLGCVVLSDAAHIDWFYIYILLPFCCNCINARRGSS